MKKGEFNKRKILNWIASLTDEEVNRLLHYSTVELNTRKTKWFRDRNICFICEGSGYEYEDGGSYPCSRCKRSGKYYNDNNPKNSSSK